MPRLLQPLWFILASMTDRKLARMVEYLKEENRILRSRLPRCITVTPRERNRLVKLGKKLGSAINELISIVTLRTFARWVARERVPKKSRMNRTPGRPRTEEEIRELILRLARDTGWGYARVLGELKKLGIRSVSKRPSPTFSVRPVSIRVRSEGRAPGAISFNGMRQLFGPPISCRFEL